MTEYLLSVDPGRSTGITLWEVPDNTHAIMLGAWQFRDGLHGFLDWYRDHTDVGYGEVVGWLFHDAEVWGTVRLHEVRAAVEKFTPLQNKGFSLTLDSVEPLRIEGALVAMGIVPDYAPDSPHWQRPNEMYWVPGKNAAEKRKRQTAWVKDRFPELHLTGKSVNAPDADDARSAQWHALAYLRRNHLPSARHYFPEAG